MPSTLLRLCKKHNQLKLTDCRRWSPQIHLCSFFYLFSTKYAEKDPSVTKWTWILSFCSIRGFWTNMSKEAEKFCQWCSSYARYDKQAPQSPSYDIQSSSDLSNSCHKTYSSLNRNNNIELILSKSFWERHDLVMNLSEYVDKETEVLFLNIIHTF